MNNKESLASILLYLLKSEHLKVIELWVTSFWIVTIFFSDRVFCLLFTQHFYFDKASTSCCESFPDCRDREHCFIKCSFKALCCKALSDFLSLPLVTELGVFPHTQHFPLKFSGNIFLWRGERQQSGISRTKHWSKFSAASSSGLAQVLWPSRPKSKASPVLNASHGRARKDDRFLNKGLRKVKHPNSETSPMKALGFQKPPKRVNNRKIKWRPAHFLSPGFPSPWSAPHPKRFSPQDGPQPLHVPPLPAGGDRPPLSPGCPGPPPPPQGAGVGTSPRPQEGSGHELLRTWVHLLHPLFHPQPSKCELHFCFILVALELSHQMKMRKRTLIFSQWQSTLTIWS